MNKNRFLIFIIIALLFVVSIVIPISTRAINNNDFVLISRVVNNIISNVRTSFFSDNKDNAYCFNNNYCVYNGKCYADNKKMNDAICVKPVLGSSNEPRAWYDCDDSDGHNDFCNYCGFGSQIKSGESGVGEYSFNGAWGCCGDDKNEYYKSGVCCNNKNDVVKNGKCYSSSKTAR